MIADRQDRIRSHRRTVPCSRHFPKDPAFGEDAGPVETRAAPRVGDEDVVAVHSEKRPVPILVIDRKWVIARLKRWISAWPRHCKKYVALGLRGDRGMMGFIRVCRRAGVWIAGQVAPKVVSRGSPYEVDVASPVVSKANVIGRVANA